MKQKCNTCKKGKEVKKLDEPQNDNIMTELEVAMTLIPQYGLSSQQVQWLVDLNNRLLKDNKTAGCGKCVVQVKKNLQNLYNRMINENK